MKSRNLIFTATEPDDGNTTISRKDSWLDEIWFDALEEDPEEEDVSRAEEEKKEEHVNEQETPEAKESVFDVTDDELKTLREDLQLNYPKEECDYMSDAYLLSVASKPYSKNMSIRRPLEYTMEKVHKVMKWRENFGAHKLIELAELAHNHKTPNASMNLEDFKAAQALATSLNTNSWYWHGLTKEGHPILWVRTSRKPWYPNVEAELNSLIFMVDTGIRCMPEGVTSFVVIAHSDHPPPPNPKFAYGMLQGLVNGFPDRLEYLISAPTSSIVEFCMNLLLPLMPGRLARKFKFLANDAVVQQTLAEELWRGEADIPNFFGGTVDHDVYYPKKGNKDNGKGCLTFDFYGMKKRLEEQSKLFEQEQQQYNSTIVAT
eukprot:CAMPEP_0178912790 /NCGR_PEP_ID=MMETSP0786-20121207/10468_1 /TAXON_ID=186022 /ORGANISM="Thalassionema frauenfeldii, Strain CCMP 1798" /LENGTH=374 /DNA_ID=CAMNT_0020585431 /DNA_START=190 /DNA_END=1314 /DNA_ORIENTATION=-